MEAAAPCIWPMDVVKETLLDQLSIAREAYRVAHIKSHGALVPESPGISAKIILRLLDQLWDYERTGVVLNDLHLSNAEAGSIEYSPLIRRGSNAEARAAGSENYSGQEFPGGTETPTGRY